jgi:organic hydroperoxide reductase OsmC/OhrA
VTADKGDAGIKIVSSKLTLVVTGLEGIDPSQLGEVARKAESGCPVSNALRGSLTIEVDARVG